MHSLRRLRFSTILALAIAVAASSRVAAEEIPSWATGDFFNPSFSNLLNGATQFALYFEQFSAANACWEDPACGTPEDPNAGFDLPPLSCCEDSADCMQQYDQVLGKVDVALGTLYKNEKRYSIIMRVQEARMTAMKGAGSMSAAGGAVVARMQADIAKAQQSFIDKFNEKTDHNISRLNEFLLALGQLQAQYCGEQDWYQRYGLPLYLHAKTKFPK